MRLDKLLSFVFTASVISVVSVNTQVTELSDTLFSNEIDVWAKWEVESDLFREIIKILAIPTELQRLDWRSFRDERSNGICTICKAVLKTFIGLRRLGTPESIIRTKIIKLCTLLNLQTKEVCTGVITLNLPIILHIVDSKPNLTSSTICGVVLESRSCPLTAEEFEWTIDIDDGPPKLISDKESNETIKILQITDIHYDPNYEPYGNPHCNEPTCCRKGQNATNKSDKLAGYWGDYNYCDTPWHAVEDALEHINSTHKNISYVYFTGDIIDHGVWETSREGNAESLNKSFRKIYETLRNLPIYPVLGNHESHPLNQFAPESITDNNLSTRWLYDLLADMWINFGWLPESTRSTIQKGGFYTLTPRKGFRVIVLNNNACYSYNWWLLYQPRDLYGQLQWLADTLLEAEKNGELVHILTHIPPGDDHCQFTWKREYHKIVNRFSHLIRAQFNGHTHNDELQVFYEENSTMKASNIAWNGGSITSYANLNPNYKVYTIGLDNFLVKNFDNWMYSLSIANKYPNRAPEWYKSYSFKEEYGLTDLSPDSLNGWLLTMSRNATVLNRYHRNFFKHAEPLLTPNCDNECMNKYLCRAITSIKDSEEICLNILRERI